MGKESSVFIPSFASVLLLFLYCSCGSRIEWKESNYERFHSYFKAANPDQKNIVIDATKIESGKVIPESVIVNVLDTSFFFKGQQNQFEALFILPHTDRSNIYFVLSRDGNRKTIYLMLFETVHGVVAIVKKVSWIRSEDGGTDYTIGTVADLNNDGILDIVARNRSFANDTDIESDSIYAAVWHQDRFVEQSMNDSLQRTYLGILK